MMEHILLVHRQMKQLNFDLENDLANIANLTGHLDSVISVMFLNSGILTRR
jgi:hypothetical protein